jgi:hypothetical protein
MNPAAQTRRNLWILLAGDILVLALVTAYGFSTHQELASAGLRLLTTFLPLVVAWLLVAPHLQVYSAARMVDPRQLWRPFWAMVLAAPLAGWLRSVMLSAAAISVLLVLVLGGVSALGMLIWRVAFWFFFTRKNAIHG